MTRKPVTVAPDASLAAARKKMGGKFRRVPVVENGKMVGIVTDRDLREHKGMLDKTKVNAVMTKKVVTVTSATPIERAARLLLRRKIGGLPVVDDGKLVGIITTSDLLKALVAPGWRRRGRGNPHRSCSDIGYGDEPDAGGNPNRR